MLNVSSDNDVCDLSNKRPTCNILVRLTHDQLTELLYKEQKNLVNVL